MRVLDLFSGIGGFSLGLERAGMETVAFCEIEDFPRSVLAKHWPDVPIFRDVRSLDYDGTVDLICGGFPCQPFSVAGQRKGADDDRHLWPAMFGLIKKYKPRWVIGENVAGFVSMALDDVLTDLEGEGYRCQSFIIPACAVNAPHRRDRVWIVAHAESSNDRGGSGEFYKKNGGQIGQMRAKSSSSSQAQTSLADPESIYAQGQHNRQGEREFRGSSWWEIEPDVGRVANGVPRRVDRLKSLGNAVVPQIPEILGLAIMEIENEK